MSLPDGTFPAQQKHHLLHRFERFGAREEGKRLALRAAGIKPLPEHKEQVTHKFRAGLAIACRRTGVPVKQKQHSVVSEFGGSARAASRHASQREACHLEFRTLPDIRWATQPDTATGAPACSRLSRFCVYPLDLFQPHPKPAASRRSGFAAWRGGSVKFRPGRRQFPLHCLNFASPVTRRLKSGDSGNKLLPELFTMEQS